MFTLVANVQIPFLQIPLMCVNKLTHALLIPETSLQFWSKF